MRTSAQFTIREFHSADVAAIKQLTTDAFNGVTLEQNVEQALGILNGHDWRWRKARHIDDDVGANPTGVFVAECKDEVVGCITALIDREAGKGRIPNLAVDARHRGPGRRLLERTLDYFRRAEWLTR